MTSHFATRPLGPLRSLRPLRPNMPQKFIHLGNAGMSINTDDIRAYNINYKYIRYGKYSIVIEFILQSGRTSEIIDVGYIWDIWRWKHYIKRLLR